MNYQSSNQIELILQNLSKDLKEVTMTLAITYEQIEAELIQKGREEGREEGEMRRSYEIAIELLRKGMEPEEVARLTKLSIAQLPQLEDEI
jgi:predicted transposase/invertase (TIGR01784 family)